MDAPMWVAMAVAAALLACVAYAARISIQHAEAGIDQRREPGTYSERVMEAIEQTEAEMSGRSSHRR
ncbi:MAG: hypothetical protein ACLFVW_07155 [Phycisphaerae bacterium]